MVLIYSHRRLCFGRFTFISTKENFLVGIMYHISLVHVPFFVIVLRTHETNLIEQKIREYIFLICLNLNGCRVNKIYGTLPILNILNFPFLECKMQLNSCKKIPYSFPLKLYIHIKNYHIKSNIIFILQR